MTCTSGTFGMRYSSATPGFFSTTSPTAYDSSTRVSGEMFARFGTMTSPDPRSSASRRTALRSACGNERSAGPSTTRPKFESGTGATSDDAAAVDRTDIGDARVGVTRR